jgi:phosphatidylserine decarboxylase
MLNRQGADQWLPASLVAVPVLCACGWLASTGEPGWWLPFAVVTVAWLAFLAFFRDPPRTPAAGSEGCMLSPADGRVSAVIEQAHHECVGGPATVVRIYLSVLDVHVNRVPWNGEVVRRAHSPGQYLDVRLAESARVNESLLLSMRAPEGFPWGVRLVAGAVARRIACTARAGGIVSRGDRMGLIKFGSTTELVVPGGWQTLVRVGDRVTGGVTPLVRVTR